MSHKKHHAASKRVRVQSPHALFDAPGKEIELTAERMTYGSDAIAHDSEGKTVFVGGAVAGDRVRAKVYQDGPSFSKAITLEVLSPSPNRVASPCPYAGICGGCPWAILSRDAQLAAKRANVVDSLRRIGHFSTQEDRACLLAVSRPYARRNARDRPLAGCQSRCLSPARQPPQGCRQVGCRSPLLPRELG